MPIAWIEPESSWPLVPLGQVAHVLPGKTPARHDHADDGAVRMVRFRDLDHGVIDWSRRDRGFVRSAALPGLRDVRVGDTLITAAAHTADRIGKKLAHVDHLPGEHQRVCYVAELLAIRSRDPAVLDPRWPYYYFRDRRGQREIARAVAGGHLTASTAARMRIALPPVAEQQRMAEILASGDAAAAATRAVIAGLDTLRHNLLVALLAQHGHQDRALGECIERMDAGWSPRCDPVPPAPGQWGVLKASSVSSGVFVPGRSKRLPAHLAPRPDLEVAPGDVLITRASGARDRVGVAVLVANAPERLMLSDKIVRVRPAPCLDPYFLTLAFMTRPVRAQIQARMTGSHMLNIAQRALAKVRIPVPPLDAQRAMSEGFSSLARRRDAEADAARQIEIIQRGLMARFLDRCDV